MLRQLPAALAHLRPQGSAPLRVHATTFTSQGLGILTQAKADLASILELTPAYFPFDLPGNMDKALDAVRPRAVALLETELWPGLLAACRRRGVPALVLNGRMTEKSLRGYGTLPWFWRALAPALVLAVSDEDADRFARAFGPADIRRMPNIKFDRLRLDAAPDAETQRPPFASLIPRQADGSAPFVVLGSVRKEEEDQVLRIIQGLRQALPGLTIGLFPRHMRRVCVWERLLREAGVPFALRSENRRGAPGSVLLWDEFGELGEAFSLASAAFLGGSLADLGGQNFLEPLAHGVVPVTGPSWSNFAWVGREIFETGIVRLVKDWQGVLAELSALALAPPDRDEIRAKAKAYAASRRGGAAAACQAVAELLKNA